MGLKMIVTVKQVPDTHNVSADAMKPDGTVNRAVLPAIFNPEDLNALEEALKIKDKLGGTVICITMGPPKAAEVLKECLFRGADDVVLVSDRRFAGADTLATSYALKSTIEKLGGYDLIFCGRQAIDGDTAQVGPQIAEKLGINQLCNISEVVAVDNKSITIRRVTEHGHEVLKSKFPCLITVTAEANDPRAPSAKKVMRYKKIASLKSQNYEEAYIAGNNQIAHIKEWDVDTIGADAVQCGLSGSPTKVKEIQTVVLKAGETKQIPNTDADVSELVHQLITEHILG